MLKQKFILGFSSKLFIQFLQIVASIVVARVAGPTVLGTVAFGLAYITMFKFVSTLGLSHAHIKLISEGKDEGDCIATYSVLKILATLLFIIVTISFFSVQKYLLHVSFESTEHLIVIFIFFVSIVIQSIGDIPINTFAAKTEQAKQDIPNIIRNIFLQLLRITVVLVGLGAIALAVSQLLSLILVLIISLFLFKKYPRGKFDKQLAKQYIYIALPMILSIFAIGFVNTLDKVFLQFFYNSAEVGYYAAGFRIGGFVSIISYSIGFLFFPVFSKAIANNDNKEIKIKLIKYSRFSYLFVMPTIIFLAIYSDSIIKILLGNGYANSINILSVVIIAMYIELITLPYGITLISKGLFKLSAKLNIINLLFFVSVLITLIHPKLFNLGGIGVAISFLLSKIFVGFLCYYYSRKYIPLVKDIKNIKYILFGLFNLFSFCIFYSYCRVQYGIMFQIAFIFIYFSLTYILLTVLKLITKDDYLELIDMINFRKMRDYIRGELK